MKRLFNKWGFVIFLNSPNKKKVNNPADDDKDASSTETTEDHSLDDNKDGGIDGPGDNTNQDEKPGGSENSDRFRIGNPRAIFLHQWRQLLAELFGTAFFVFFGTGTAVAASSIQGNEAAVLVAFSLCFGWAASACVYATAHVSGGHLNPSITIGMLLRFRISLIKAIAYIVCQVVGGILGSAFLKGAIPEEVGSRLNYGATSLARGVAGGFTYQVSLGNGVFMEILITFFLVWVVLATVQSPGDKEHLGRMAPMAIGLAIMAGNFVAGNWTGASMNPARSFGPAVISGMWDDHWVYWVGPIVGAILAAGLYRLLEETKYKPNYTKYVPYI